MQKILHKMNFYAFFADEYSMQITTRQNKPIQRKLIVIGVGIFLFSPDVGGKGTEHFSESIIGRGVLMLSAVPPRFLAVGGYLATKTKGELAFNTDLQGLDFHRLLGARDDKLASDKAAVFHVGGFHKGSAVGVF